VTLSEYQLLVIGSDIVTLMDAEKAFDSLDYYLIRDRMQKLVPTNYEMLIRLEGNFSTVEVGGDIPQKRFMLAGRKVGLTDNDVFLKITYFIWMRVQ